MRTRKRSKKKGINVKKKEGKKKKNLGSVPDWHGINGHIMYMYDEARRDRATRPTGLNVM